jgi:hypothetical protein
MLPRNSCEITKLAIKLITASMERAIFAIVAPLPAVSKVNAIH